MSASTIFDVAERAGVSIKTVSRVVNNEANVAAKTRERVQLAIDQLGYQPNSAARGLSSGRSYVIGMAYENPNEFSYMKDILNGALRACEATGYSLLLKPVVLPEAALVDRIMEFAVQARLDGLILTAPLCDDQELIASLHNRAVKVACISPKAAVAGAVNALSDDEGACFAVTDYVIRQGHARVGFIKGHPDHGASLKRLRGYKKALAQHGIRYQSALVTPGYFDFASGRKGAGRLLDRSEPPTVIIAANDNMAAGVMFEARERGMAVPQDLGVVGFDDTPIASQVWPPLTTVRQPIGAMADFVVRQLIQKLGEPLHNAIDQTFTCQVIVRDSTEPVAGAPSSITR